MKKLLNGVLVDLTQEEINQRLLDIQEENIRIENEKNAIAEKEAKETVELANKEINKQSALTKLSALGLTEAEIKSIIG